MSRASRTAVGFSAGRLVVLTIVLVPVVLLCLSGLFWIQGQVPRWVYWKMGLIALMAAEVAYGVALACAVVGAPVLGFLVSSRRRRGGNWPLLARGLLVCVSLLFGFVAAEAASAVWQQRSHRTTVVPIGGFGRSAGSNPAALRPAPPETIELPTGFPDPPGDRDIDLVVVGESSAEGVPFQKWLSIGKIIAWQLGEAIPGRPIHLRVLAQSGTNLEGQHKVLAILDRRPDIVIIYCGHNEFKSRFDTERFPEYYFNDRVPTTTEVLLDRLERSSPLLGLMRETADKCRIAIPPPQIERDLIEVPVYTTAESNALLADFRRRLEAMVSYTEQVGALPILILPSANDSGYEPNRSFLPAETPRGEREAFRREFLAARRQEDDDPAAAVAAYRELVARQPGFAETHYRLARLLERVGAWDEAYRHDIAARDCDGYPMRCMTAFQEVYREVAARHGCPFIDGQAYFHAIGPHGLLDDHLFQDMMHPSLRGYIALSQAVLQVLRARGAFGWPQDSPVQVIDPARCAAHFGLGTETWKHLCRWEKGFNELTHPLRYDPSERLRKREVGIAAERRLTAGVAPEALGLPNVGIPESVPLVPMTDIDPVSASDSRRQAQAGQRG